MTGRFELKRADRGRFVFNLRAGNGRIILTSGLYDSRKAAAEGIATVIACAHDRASIERKVASNGRPYFVMTSSTGDLLARSEVYSSAAALERGIESVLQSIAGATLRDLTEPARELASH